MFAERYIQMGAKIKYYRTVKKLERNDFAEKIGITPQYLSKIERGHAKASTDLLFKIAEELGVDITQLMSSNKHI